MQLKNVFKKTKKYVPRIEDKTQSGDLIVLFSDRETYI